MADQGIEHTTSQNWLRVLSIFALVAAVAVTVLLAFAWRREIPAITPPPRASFEAPLIERGALLASAGNCIACHTVQGGQPFAGGLPLVTPFGTIYSTNITPDPATGIGNWSQPAFDRSMREGVDRRGSHLYPAFPYTHFTRITDDDLAALYAYLMTRTPTPAPARTNELIFPLGFRPLMAGWNLLFFQPGPYQANSSQSAEWNRGAYLADGLAHCSACHSPLNALGAERKREYLGGGIAEGWYSPALNTSSPSPVPWNVDDLTTYLRTGVVANHAIAGGPMQDVVRSLGQLPEKDVRAIASYIHASMGGSTPEREARASANMQRATQGLVGTAAPARTGDSSGDEATLALGASVYANACASCHASGRGISSGSALQLPLAVAVYEPTPASLIRIVLEGIKPRDGERGRWMPSFAGALSEDQLTALAFYLRRAAANEPPWPNLTAEVRKAKKPS
jgi:mono/diheme cytochrome c family protein